MEYEIGLVNSKTSLFAKTMIGMFSAAIVAVLALTFVPEKPVRKAENASWWVATQDRTACLETEDPYKLSSKMCEEGRDSKVTKHYEGNRYDINWTWNGKFMERNVYGSKGACEHDQQISR